MSKNSAGKVDPFADMPIWKVLTYIGLQATFFTALGVALWVIADGSQAPFIAFNWVETAHGLILAAALIAFSFAMAKAFPKYAEWLIRSQAANYSFLRHRISLGSIVFISLCAGIGEEALFRGGLQTLLGDHLPVPLALIVAAALFALIHFAQPLSSALIFAIGCLFGVIYWQTESLLTVMIGHAVYDIYALWALQEAMHELGVFEDASELEADQVLPDEAARETLASTQDTKGESP
ncbi:MAG: type II CAAX endopeptidase family protein [Pseudomonadota bacterium]